MVFLFVAKQIAGDKNILVGLVAALQALPFLIFSPLAGRMADRIDRRKLMLFSDFASTGALLLLAVYLWFNPHPPLYVVCIAGFLMSCINVFFMPARTAAIPKLVPADRLTDANALALSTQSLVGVVGLGVSVILIAPLEAASPEWFFFSAVILNSLTFAVSGFMIAGLPKLEPEQDADKKENTFWVDLVEGWNAVRKDSVLQAALPAYGVMSVILSGFIVIYLETNVKWYGGGLGSLLGIELAFVASMAVGSLLLARFKVVRPGISFACAMAVAGLCVFAMGWGQIYWVFIAWNILCGLIIPFAFIPITTYMQMAFPDGMRGRVSSVWNMISMGVQPVGLFLAGPLLEIFDLTTMYVVIGLGITIPALIPLFSSRYRRTETPEMPVVSLDV
jgi:MFS family permease